MKCLSNKKLTFGIVGGITLSLLVGGCSNPERKKRENGTTVIINLNTDLNLGNYELYVNPCLNQNYNSECESYKNKIPQKINYEI